MGLEQNDQSIIFSNLTGHYYDRHPELTQFIPDTVRLICKSAEERGVSITQRRLMPGMDYDNDPHHFEHMLVVVAVNAYHTRTRALRGYLDDEINIYLGALTES